MTLLLKDAGWDGVGAGVKSIVVFPDGKHSATKPDTSG
jgi:hypothetical protein